MCRRVLKKKKLFAWKHYSLFLRPKNVVQKMFGGKVRNNGVNSNVNRKWICIVSLLPVLHVQSWTKSLSGCDSSAPRYPEGELRNFPAMKNLKLGIHICKHISQYCEIGKLFQMQTALFQNVWIYFIMKSFCYHKQTIIWTVFHGSLLSSFPRPGECFVKHLLAVNALV